MSINCLKFYYFYFTFSLTNVNTFSNSGLMVPGLGRDFRLGCLYNERKDELMNCGSINIWNTKNIEKNTKRLNYPSVKAKVIATEASTVQAFDFNMNAHVKASFLFGLVKVNGAATFLKSHAASKYEASVIFTYEKVLYSTLISPDILTIPDFNPPDDSDATHVVIKIDHGGSAVLAFKESKQEYSKRERKDGQLIFGVEHQLGKIQDGFKLNLTEEQKKNYRQLSCTYEGDHMSGSSKPKNFEEALDTFANYHKAITAETAKPVTVFLFPIDGIIGDQIRKLRRRVSVNVLTEIEDSQAAYQDLYETATELQKETSYQKLTHLKAHVDAFQQYLKYERSNYDKNVREALVKAREMENNEGILQSLAESGMESAKSLKEWLAIKSEEMAVLKRVCNWKPSKIHSKTTSFVRAPDVVLFVLKLFRKTDKYLDCIKRANTHACEESKQSSWYDATIRKIVGKSVNDFIRAMEVIEQTGKLSSRSHKNLKFGITERELLVNENPSIFTELYKHGVLHESGMEFPDIENVSINRTCTELKISWDSSEITNEVYPSYGFIVRHRTNRHTLGPTNWVDVSVQTNSASIQLPFIPNIEFTMSVQILRECIFGYCAQVQKQYESYEISEQNLPELQKCYNCSNNPCHNGGKCNKEGNCGCPLNFFGFLCQYEEVWTNEISKGEKLCNAACQREVGLGALSSDDQAMDSFHICKAKYGNKWLSGWKMNGTRECLIACNQSDNCAPSETYKCLCSNEGTKWTRASKQQCSKVCAHSTMEGPLFVYKDVDICRVKLSSLKLGGHSKFRQGHYLCCVHEAGKQHCSLEYDCLCKVKHGQTAG